MTQEIGESYAKTIGDIHEECGNNPGGETAMDLANNATGRSFEAAGEGCHLKCFNAAQNNGLQTSLGGTPPSNIY